MKPKIERKENIDILKVIGLFCIILAHIKTSGVVFQLRNFDVVLMILISSYLGILTYKGNYISYITKRIKRLVLPTWFFLLIFFIINFITKMNSYSIGTIIDSYILNKGIGYVWIIRVYLIVALLIPVSKKAMEKKKEINVIVSTIIIYILYEVLCVFGIFDNPLLYYFFAFIIPCYVLIIISNYLFKMDNKRLICFSIVNLVIFVILCIYFYKTTGHFHSTQIHKYPFRIYYLSYALFVSSTLIAIFNNKKVCSIFRNKITNFISRNSLWIYLWHILALTVVNLFDLNWIVKLLIVIIISIIITLIQSIIINKIENKSNSSLLEIFKG